jgi:energy-coupling factor transporter ATP-binding protein EcfA2
MELAELKKRNTERKATVHFNSKFKHLMDHNGFRPGELHLLVGPKGGGKSSLFRNWIIESVAQGKIVYVRLSEDKRLDYLDEMATFFSDRNFHLMKNLIIDTEKDLTESEFANYFPDLEMKVKNSGADIVFYDNLTSSRISMQGVSKEADNAVKLRFMADKLDLPMVVAAHTEKAFKSNSVASGDNVRGNQTISNVAAYIYGITVFFNHPEKPTIIFTDKARHHGKANKKYYKIDFSVEMATFTKDCSLGVDDMKKIIKELK